MANDPERLPEADRADPDSPATAADSSTDSSEHLWLPVLLGILCTVAVVAALFGITLLAIWWRG